MRLYLATGNAHKVGELTSILAAAQVDAQVFPPAAVGGMPEVDEDAPTFEGNARKKALALAAKLPGDAWAIADDSGLVVNALGGAPGVISARFAGPRADDATNNLKLLSLLHDLPRDQRTASFHCCIVAAAPDGRSFAFAGTCGGHLLAAPRGARGFGYDPLFVPEGHTQTFAELDAAVKNQISHRARALAELARWVRHFPIR